MRVKICGITNVADAKGALEAGADAIGLVFAESPRRVPLERALEITEAVGPWMTTVGVFVNEAVETIKRVASQCRLSCVQLHGEEGVDAVKALSSYRVTKAFQVDKDFDLKKAAGYAVDAFLFDNRMGDRCGGTGKVFDWDVLKAALMRDPRLVRRPVIVSGGLNPRNVKDVIRALSPYGVDVSSGVESTPGKKDFKLMREFVQNAKS
ncbi:MAG: phosphoribosylanthranilate isomerase [Candidatus Omnitrophica bacterium]|nr:phosphoribosylanthranilate isomerase [Candidatus Omnitrophota bacterium]